MTTTVEGTLGAMPPFANLACEPRGAVALVTVSRVEKYNALASRGASFGLVPEKEANLQRHVTERALDGLYLMIGEEERRIREDPIGTGSKILKQVFGGR